MPLHPDRVGRLKLASHLVIVAGNPNAGKTTLFNSLTGSTQKVANYPGVTVESVEGQYTFAGETIRCVDVPGLYSLKAASEDERVATDVILGRQEGKPELVVYVLDATNLERNLFLFTQIAESQVPMVIALTMPDRLQARGKKVDLERLQSELGVPVVSVVAHEDRKLESLKQAISDALRDKPIPAIDFGLPEGMQSTIRELSERLARIGVDASQAEIRRNLYEPPELFQRFLEDFPEIAEPFTEARNRLEAEDLLRPSVDVTSRYEWSAKIQSLVLRDAAKPAKVISITDRLDKVLTHRFWGLTIFVLVMYGVFQSIYTVAAPMMAGIEDVFGRLQDAIRPMVSQNEILESFIIDGLIAGVGGMLVFLPQILILFFFIAVLEGSGYLARAAFLMDRLLGWCGLNGRAFIPFLSSYACAIPGIMAARVMPDSKSRLATILVAPLMSCSARLPVYVLLIGTFIEPQYGAFWAGFSLFAMHLLGLVVAIPVVYVLNRKMLKARRLPFVLELPPYQWPKWRDIWLTLVNRGKVFVKTAGTIIVFMSILIWAAASFPRFSPADPAAEAAKFGVAEERAEQWVQEKQLENSVLGRFGKAIEPVFIPAGFDWRITTAILSAFPARETIVPSLGIIFSLGGEVDESSGDLQSAMKRATWPNGRPLFTVWTAVGLMVFFALCAQCMATLATVKRETNSWKWAVFMFCYMTALAYVGAVAVNYLGKLFGA